MEKGARCARNELFQELKPRCVELSQLALKDVGSPGSSKSLIESTGKLLNTLQQKCQRTDGVFDERLADYVFFPLAQILRRKQKYTDNLSELTIKCLRVLLEYGWRDSIALDLAKQLLLLLTFVAGGTPGQESARVPEELVIEAYGALAALFRDLGRTPGGPVSLVETSAVPALGHCVTVILDGITDGPSAEVQIQALQALEIVWICVKDPQALSNFLPGTISALTKCLMPGTANRRSRNTLVTALDVLKHVLVSILSDIMTRNIKDSGDLLVGSTASNSEQKTLTKSWLKATTAQIKLALSNVIRLRNHESMDVRKALNSLCITVLDECHDTLAESASMLVETCMTFSGVEVQDSMNRRTTLEDLATIHPDMGQLINGTVYNWATSLPRVMQSNDEAAKRTALGQLATAHELLGSLNLESSILKDTLASSLRDSVTVMLESLPKRGMQEAEFDFNSQEAMTLATNNIRNTKFRPIILSQESQKQTREQLIALLGSLGTEHSQLHMASEMLEYVRGASGPGVISAYWLSSQLVRAAVSRNQDLDEFFTPTLTSSDDREAVSQELFSYSQSILSGPDEGPTDWRLQAIALEVVADTAQHLKEEFKIELVDTLYPVAQILGSSNPKLREHAITCLNVVSKACGYSSASDMIVDNVDYMVNAISLKLNTFDISPQAPQVLVMMIRLTGPSLLLYLDDVVGSIFAALDNFHGYHRLVEVLFAVLGEIVDVGAKSGQLQITGTPNVEHRKTGAKALTIDDLVKEIEKKRKLDDGPIEHEDFPRKPWKDAKTLLDEANTPPPEDEEGGQDEAEGEVEKTAPTKTYTMVQSIARLGQYYLTNQSPTLRAKLLRLVGTACRALHNNESEFLPLINDIWPVIVKRLYDEEPFVAIAAADALVEICRGAGDFLATRIQTEWLDLMKMARQARARMAVEKKGSGGRGIYSQAHQVWEGFVRLMIAILEYVRIDDEMFDEVIELFADHIAVREDIREALSVTNADAVWLAMQKTGLGRTMEVPVLAGYQFAALHSSMST